MSSLKEKERFKELQEQFQAVLSNLLKDEDNKYCVDCDAKGPRWASWNIGVFLCIRCAGIHRNLGVHISKVKSVNLDTWTPEQVSMMQEMGNSRGRAVYEANIPDGFRRPQTDSSLEAFIRSKYEHKKYIAREWIPPQPRVPKESVNDSWMDDPRGDKKKAKAKGSATSLQLTNVPKLVNKSGETTPPGDYPRPAQTSKAEVKVPAKTETVPPPVSSDLLGLDLGSPQTFNQKAAAPPASSGSNELLDLFGGPQQSEVNGSVPAQSSSSDLMNGASEGSLFGEDKNSGGKKTSAKESIMALYGGGGGGSGITQPQMYGVPAPSTEQSVLGLPASSLDGLPGVYGAFQMGSAPGMVSTSCFSQPTVYGVPQKTSPALDAGLIYSSSGQNSYPPRQMQTLSSRGGFPLEPQDMGLNVGSNTGWGCAGQQMQFSGYGGMYVPPVQPLYPGMIPQQQGIMGQPQGMMGQPQGVMGMQGVRPHGIMGQPAGMMGQPQNMGMMGQVLPGQQLGMMGNPGVNPQMAAYNNQMLAGNQALYNPQQLQQLQFQQMQQQMTSLKLGGPQLGAVPQPAAAGGAGTWGVPGQGQTLSTNLWQ